MVVATANRNQISVYLGVETQLLDPTLLDDPAYLLRPVDKSSAEYLELTESVRRDGVLNAILVRPKGTRYEVVDGFHRLSVCRDLRVLVPCVVKTLSDDDVLAHQVTANSLRFETRPAEYAARLLHLQRKTGKTVNELAVMLSRSPLWIKNQFSLTQLIEQGQAAVDDGSLPLGSAYEIAKLPELLQYKWLPCALNRPSKEFIQELLSDKRDVTSARHQVNSVNGPGVKPYLRHLKELQSMLSSPSGISSLCSEFNTAEEGFTAALRWVMHLDDASVRKQGRRWRIRQRKELKRHIQLRGLHEQRTDDNDCGDAGSA